jgi:hypothetical protein
MASQANVNAVSIFSSFSSKSKHNPGLARTVSRNQEILFVFSGSPEFALRIIIVERSLNRIMLLKLLTCIDF